MDHLECPSESVWESRRYWFEKENDQAQGLGSYLVSEQACALLAEVQAVYCAGAWVAVVMLALSVIDAQFRETEVLGFKGDTQRLILEVGANPDLQWLRKRRNTLVHVNPDSPAVTVDQQWFERDTLEKDAQRAIKLMFEAFYLSPGL